MYSLCVESLKKGSCMKSSLLILAGALVSFSCAAAEPPAAKPDAAKPDNAKSDAAATPVAKTPAKPAAPSSAGYLAKASSGPLRFAPAVPPRSTTELPALPVVPVQQLTRPPEFPKVVEGPQTIVTTRAPETMMAVYPPAEQSAASNKGSIQLNAFVLTPQALVRFFPHGKVEGAEAVASIPFQVPIRPTSEGSSATYTVK